MGNSSFTRSALDPSSIIEAACKMATSSHEETTMSKSLSSFPLEIFPQQIQNIILTYLRHEGFNSDFLCGSFFTVFAASMGNLYEARFTTTMRVSPIIYVVLIGPPSSGKTPPLREAEKPLQNADRESDIEYHRLMQEYNSQMNMSKNERMVQGLPENPDKPIHKELLVIDSTIEKLFGILSENPHGILMFVNELNKLVSNLNRYGKGSDEAYWIEFFDGNQVKYERKSTSDYINIFRPYVSVVGGTQPGLLAKMFGGDKEASGFTSRFLKIFPDITSMPKWGREPMPVGVEEEWAAIISEVLHTHCEYDANGEIIPQILHFSKNAMNVLFKWEEHICSEWENTDDYMQGVCGRLKTYIVRFCLIIHVMRLVCKETNDDVINEDIAKSACLLADYFLEMDKRVHNIIRAVPVDVAHQQLFDSLPDSFTTSEAVAKGNALGLSERTVKRFLSNGQNSYLKKDRHGIYSKME
ncbi:MAG: DUF3987 domain-containing protein [Prevotella sp.]|jgi:hypothetical protein|uniref:DUF3987 domain-containing protein n=1 Tax=uncultured Prevotella sp. TaxID=159272 RepID=UPI001CAF3A96|nr:DUF3987 domain-containing protein [Prevotella sp.]MBF1610135.1 DUF3987 domain-containing protein [Prevotella sp.]